MKFFIPYVELEFTTFKLRRLVTNFDYFKRELNKFSEDKAMSASSSFNRVSIFKKATDKVVIGGKK